jgi:hypothetical protein
MSLFNDFVNGFLFGVAGERPHHAETPDLPFHRQVPAVCAQANLAIAAQDRDSVTLHFQGAGVAPRRTVRVKDLGDGVVTVFCPCAAALSGEPARGAAAALLKSNMKLLFCQWAAMDDADGDTIFCLNYQCHLPALTPRLLAYLCRMMAKYTADFDALCIREGLVS